MRAKKSPKVAEPIVVDSDSHIEAPLPVEISQTPVGMISRESFEEKIKALQDLSLFKNDTGTDAPFEGEVKEEFIRACKESYPILNRSFETMYEWGRFLHGVRARLRPHKMYYSWLEFIGIPQGTARNYVQPYERFEDELLQFAYLGLKKLLIASRMPDCKEYVREHEAAIAAQTAEELERERSRQGGRRLFLQARNNGGLSPSVLP